MDVSDKNVSFFKQSWVNSSNPPSYKSDQSFLVLVYEIMEEKSTLLLPQYTLHFSSKITFLPSIY